MTLCGFGSIVIVSATVRFLSLSASVILFLSFSFRPYKTSLRFVASGFEVNKYRVGIPSSEVYPTAVVGMVIEPIILVFRRKIKVAAAKRQGKYECHIIFPSKQIEKKMLPMKNGRIEYTKGEMTYLWTIPTAIIMSKTTNIQKLIPKLISPFVYSILPFFIGSIFLSICFEGKII